MSPSFAHLHRRPPLQAIVCLKLLHLVHWLRRAAVLEPCFLLEAVVDPYVPLAEVEAGVVRLAVEAGVVRRAVEAGVVRRGAGVDPYVPLAAVGAGVVPRGADAAGLDPCVPREADVDPCVPRGEYEAGVDPHDLHAGMEAGVVLEDHCEQVESGRCHGCGGILRHNDSSHYFWNERGCCLP